QNGLGGPFDENAGDGPLISAAHRQKVAAYEEKGVAEGARPRCGGKFGQGELADGLYDLPADLDQVKRGMTVVRDEAFGPVPSGETFSTVDAAIEIANDTHYARAGAVWSQDAGKTQLVAQRLRHGTIWINDFHPSLPQAEWGGF